MNFISYDRFVYDILDFERRLPPYAAVAGIPRSGVLPATLLALQRNVLLLDLETFLANPHEALRVAREGVRRINPLKHRKGADHVLIVDDSAGKGNTIASVMGRMDRVKQCLDLQVHFAVIYTDPKHKLPFLSCREVPKPRMFEWNWTRHEYLKASMVEIETFRDRQKPLRLPEWPVHTIVVPDVEDKSWLDMHHVAYQHLFVARDIEGKAAYFRDSKAAFYIAALENTAEQLGFLIPPSKQALSICAQRFYP